MTSPHAPTQGPWRVKNAPGALCITSGSRQIAIIKPPMGMLTHEDERNALAIAKLPEMMEVLELLAEAQNPALFAPLQSRARAILTQVQGAT